MRYSDISLLRRVDSATSALWPAVPTGGVPHLMSLGWACDQDADAVIPSRATAATVVRTRLRIDANLQVLRSLMAGRTVRPCLTKFSGCTAPIANHKMPQRSRRSPPKHLP